MLVNAKKSLGQHFLKDQNIARKISEQLSGEGYSSILEIGPGTGVLTRYLTALSFPFFEAIEIDTESVEYLAQELPEVKVRQADFLKVSLANDYPKPLAIIGNFPYNISSQIFFKVLANKDQVCELVGMIQKEVAERIASPHGSKVYGILSVLVQAFYSVELLMKVPPGVFTPPPKVDSAVLRLQRNGFSLPEKQEKAFFRIVKAAFNQRRKTLRNSLKSAGITNVPEACSGLRPEQLSVADFIKLTEEIETD